MFERQYTERDAGRSIRTKQIPVPPLYLFLPSLLATPLRPAVNQAVRASRNISLLIRLVLHHLDELHRMQEPDHTVLVTPSADKQPQAGGVALPQLNDSGPPFFSNFADSDNAARNFYCRTPRQCAFPFVQYSPDHPSRRPRRVPEPGYKVFKFTDTDTSHAHASLAESPV